MLTYHIQKRGETLRTYCGRRVGTPGGEIYPGVRAEWPEWFDEHTSPDVIEPATCKACRKARESETAQQLDT